MATVRSADSRPGGAGWPPPAAALATAVVGLIVPVVPLVGIAATALGTLFGWLGGSRERAEPARVERAQRQHLKEQVLPRIDTRSGRPSGTSRTRSGTSPER